MAAPRRTAKQAPQHPTWFSPALLAGGLVIGAALVYFGYPGAVAAWLFATVGAWVAAPALFTGKKDATGYPTPASPREAAAMQRYRFWSDLKWRLIFPTSALAPGWPVYASWLAGLWGAAFVWCLPHAEVPLLGAVLRHLDAVFTFVLVTQVAAARRRTVVAGDVSPGVRLDAAKKIRTAERRTVLVASATTLASALAAGYLTSSLLPAPPVPLGAHVWWLLAGLGGAGAGVAKWWVAASLGPWRTLVEARAEWAPRWQMLKHDPAPRLTAREKVGNATIDTFVAPGSMGAMAYWPLGPKVMPTMGAGQRIAILSTPNVDSQDQPIPGTRHPLRFQVVYWPSDATPDITALDADADEVSLFIQCSMVWVADSLGYARPILNEATPLGLVAAGDEQPEPEGETGGSAPATSARQSWGSTWLLPDGPPMDYIRKVLAGPLSDALGCEVLVDHRNGFVFSGALTDGGTVFDPSTGIDPDALRRLALEDLWNHRWGAILKQDANPPTIEHTTYGEATLANGRTLYRQAFVTRQGVDPMEFFGLEAKISASMDAAPYAAVCGWGSSRRGDRTARAGERHPQAFTVYWSLDPVPANPDVLVPAGGREEAAQWVLAGRINQAFKAARLAQPEIYDAICLTSPRSRGGHIWKMPLRLYGGVTLADVRGASQRLRQALGSEWLRVEAAEDGCILVAGASPAKVTLSRPERDEAYLASLNWEQAWLDSKVAGVGGLTPTLIGVGRLPSNEAVQVLDFEMPSGLSVGDVKAATKKLETATANSYVDVRESPDGRADKVRILACEVNPLPERVSFDFDAIDKVAGIPFATGVEGEPIVFEPLESPHALLAGVTGAGKAQPLTARIPVPVSDRFPSGWARNADLRIGDLVYTANGSTTPIVGFSPVATEPVYEVEFADGQVVECSAEHLWKASSASSRRSRTPATWRRRTSPAAALRAERVASLRALAVEVGPGRVAPLSDIARLSGAGLSLVHRTAPRHLAVDVLLPAGKKTGQFPVVVVLDHYRPGMSLDGHQVDEAGLDRLRALGETASIRAIAAALTGANPTRGQRDRVKARLRKHGIAPISFAAEERFVPCFPVDEMLTLLADSYEASTRDLQPLEAVVSTREMLASLRDSGHNDRHNWAVRVADPIDGPAADLPVDPYVLGAWLGDGSSWHPDCITSMDAEIVAEIVAAGFPVRRCEPRDGSRASAWFFDGLRAALADAGMARTKGRPATKRIPASYLRASATQRIALLQGLMDTDGTVDSSGRCELSLSDERLAADALELIRSLGIKASTTTGPASYRDANHESVECKARHRIHFTTATATFRLPRKVARQFQHVRPTQDWNYVIDVRVTEPAPMRCLSVADAEHLYLTGGFVSTHNSVLAQAFLFGFLARGAEVYVIDPIKGGADFQFARPYSKAFADDPFQAAGVMKAVYAEVVRRKNLNAQHGVGSYRDLPNPPLPIVVMIDEFTSLMGQSPVPKPSDDPEMERERALILADNHARTEVGVLAGKLAREARSAGVTLLLGTQKLTAKMLDSVPGGSDLKTNLARVLLGKASFGDRASALRSFDSAPMLEGNIPKGRGLWEPLTSSAVTVQCWFAPQADLGAHLASRVSPLPESEMLDVSAFGPPDPEIDGMILDGLDEAPARGAMPSPAEPVTVTDLGDFTFSLDDLDTDDEDPDAEVVVATTEAETAEPAPFDWAAAEVEVTSEPPLDWSASFADAPAPAPELDWSQSVADAPTAPDEADPVLVETHTIWDEIDPSAWEPVASEYGWTEIEALLGFLDDFPLVRHVTWSDIHLLDEDDLGIAYLDVVTDLLAERGVTLAGPARVAEEPAQALVPVAAAPVAVPAEAASTEVDFDWFEESAGLSLSSVLADPEPDDEFAPPRQVDPRFIPDHDDFA